MNTFSFHTIFENGRTVEINPDYVRPFGVNEIRELDKDWAAPLKVYLEADKVIIDGKQQIKRTNVTTNIKFNEATTIYALISGGWLPLPFAIPSRFLVDRNVIISLRKIREGRNATNAESLKWWTRFFSQKSTIFNPLPFAYESGFQRKPTLSEFIQAFDEGAYELQESLPGCQVISFQKQQYKAAYAQLEAFDNRNEHEVNFLKEVCPIVSQRISRQMELEITELIFNVADSNFLNRASFVVIAVLSCIYEDIQGMPPAIGRKVLKPKQIYTDSAAFNALSDIRHLEVAAAGQAYFSKESFHLCTCDRPLALMWSALSVKGKHSSTGDLEFTCNLNSELFSRLNKNELIHLGNLIKNSL